MSPYDAGVVRGDAERWVGAVLEGRYVIDRPLGRGGMGAVFEGRHVGLGRRVAIKLLHPELARETEHVARFRREAKVVGALRHPHIVEVLDTSGDASEGPAYCVMELLEGPSLSAVLREVTELEPARAVRIARQVLSALAAAHAAGVVHRDIKPPNIVIVTGYDGSEVAKVVDFGVAHLTETLGYTRLTQTGQIIGTPTYMAPEQASGHVVDARSDVYAVGAVLFTALAGKPPFGRGSAFDVLPRVLTGDRPRLLEVAPQIDPSLAEIVERAMAVDPAVRFQSATDMERALADFATGVPSARAAPTIGQRPRNAADEQLRASMPMPRTVPAVARRERRLPTWIVATVVAIGMAIGGGAIAYVVRTRGGAGADASEPDRAAPAPVPAQPVRAAPAPPGVGAVEPGAMRASLVDIDVEDYDEETVEKEALKRMLAVNRCLRDLPPRPSASAAITGECGYSFDNERGRPSRSIDLPTEPEVAECFDRHLLRVWPGKIGEADVSRIRFTVQFEPR